MTKYLSPQPFSAPVSNGKMTKEQYDIAVGNGAPPCATTVSEFCPHGIARISNLACGNCESAFHG